METNLSNFLIIIVISNLLLYKLVTYNWKGLKDIYNFVIGSISIKTHMQKLWSHKFWTWLLHGGTQIKLLA
jgi:hypothetical protein